MSASPSRIVGWLMNRSRGSMFPRSVTPLSRERRFETPPVGMARPNRGSGTRAFGGLVIERETGRARTRHPREQRGAGAAQRRQDVADDRRNRPRGRFEIVAALQIGRAHV